MGLYLSTYYFEKSIDFIVLCGILCHKRSDAMAWEDDIEENIKCGLVEFLILALLTTEDMYGYRIKTELAVRTNNAIIVKEGSLYGPLYRMEQRKLISSRKELVGEKRFRNYYHIEPPGEEYLDYAIKKFQLIFGGAANLIKGCGLDENKPE